MSFTNSVSRSDLFNNGTPDSSSDDEMLIPPEEIEIIQVNPTVDTEENANEIEIEQDEQEESFEFFPLFSTEGLTKVEIKTVEEEEKEFFIQRERPMSYYMADYTIEEKHQFEQSAIAFDDIWEKAPYSNFKNPVINLNEYNDTITELNKINSIKVKRKMGKKQRLAKKMGKLHVQEREDQIKMVKKLIKKKFGRRGGKKNKKKEKLNPLADI